MVNVGNDNVIYNSLNESPGDPRKMKYEMVPIAGVA